MQRADLQTDTIICEATQEQILLYRRTYTTECVTISSAYTVIPIATALLMLQNRVFEGLRLLQTIVYM